MKKSLIEKIVREELKKKLGEGFPMDAAARQRMAKVTRTAPSGVDQLYVELLAASQALKVHKELMEKYPEQAKEGYMKAKAAYDKARAAYDAVHGDSNKNPDEI